MTKFRPCIDLHAGSVKQIVGGTLSTSTPSDLKTNWTSEHPSAYYASLYKEKALAGAHVIMLGPGNDAAAQEALEAWKGGMQVGGGITEANAREWIERGAERVSRVYFLGHGEERGRRRGGGQGQGQGQGHGHGHGHPG
jgi:phosphoribosylformimino-5-aminoimidazole carboxamide ribotide isomerase